MREKIDINMLDIIIGKVKIIIGIEKFDDTNILILMQMMNFQII